MFASTKGRYALRVLADLAEHDTDENEYIPLKDIARRQEISEKYLEAIVKLLVKEKLLIGVRGKEAATAMPESRKSIRLVRSSASRRAGSMSCPVLRKARMHARALPAAARSTCGPGWMN